MEHTQTDNPDYNQYWFYVTTPEYNLYPNSMNGCKNPGKHKKMTSRMVGITTPKILDYSKKYKYILNNDFNIDGKSSDWWCGSKQYQGLGGIISQEWCTSDKQYRMKTLMNLFKKFIKEDYIIVHLSLTYEDGYYNQPLYKDSTDVKNPCNKIWYPNNPDQQYLESLFNVIYKNTFPSPINNLKISYNDISLFGFSVGTGAVSRYINEFPFLQTKPDMYKFPLIKSAVMVAGGSLYCYSKIFSPCFDTNTEQRGCCPSDLSEPNFDNGVIPWSKHPPVILIQSVDDSYADPMASTYYHNIMIKNNVPSKKVLDDTVIHGISSENQVQAIIDWVKQYFNPLIPIKPIPVKPSPQKKCVVNDKTGKELKVSSLIISLVIVIVLFIILIKEYKNNKDKTIIAGIFLFIVGVLLIISLILTLKNKVKTQISPPQIIPISPTGSKNSSQNLDQLPILQRQLMTIRKPSIFTAGQLFDKVVDIKNQIYSDYPDIGGVLVHLADLETLQTLVTDTTEFEFNLSSGNGNFICDCSLLGQNKANCSAWTYLRKDLPPIVFSYSNSPAVENGYWTPSIGFIVDPSMLWPIINTMGVTDSATYGRNCGSDQDTSSVRIFDVKNRNGRCNPKVYTAEGKLATDQEDYCIFKSQTTLTGCKNDCSYEKDIINTNCRFKNSGASLNSNSWVWDNDLPGFSWDCPNPDYRIWTDPTTGVSQNWTDPLFTKGVPECYKAVEINWSDISKEDRKMLENEGYGKSKYCNKWAKYIPSDNCYATSPSLYQPYSTPSGSTTSGKLIANTNLEVSSNDRNYMYVGESIDSNTSGPTFSQQTWENCEISNDGSPINCGAGSGPGEQNANGDKNVPISVSYIMNRQFKWLKKDWGRWIEEITKMWKYIYSTLSEKDGYKNRKVGINGDDKSTNYNYIYGNACNGADWWENEVNIYVNDTIAKDENSDLNKLFRNSMLGMFYIGKSCEDFTSDLPTGTDYGEGCKFSNSVERCVGYLCTATNINTKDPTKSHCDFPVNGKKITYGEIKTEESKRMEESKQAVISFVSKFNTKYRSGLNGITAYKLMTASNSYQTWPCLDKLFKGKLSSADVFIPI